MRAMLGSAVERHDVSHQLSGAVDAAEELRRNRPVYRDNENGAVGASSGNIEYAEEKGVVCV